MNLESRVTGGAADGACYLSTILADVPAGARIHSELLIGRLLTGVAIGLAAGVAIPYLIELRLSADPKASPVGARNFGTAVNVGALGIGPLLAGSMAQRVAQPLTVPYIVMIALGAVALIGVASAPETGARPVATTLPAEPPRRARLPVPAAAATIAAFAASGLFAGLSGLILAGTLHQTSHALSGAALFLVFTAGVAAQLGTTRLTASRVLTFGAVSMIVGLVLLVVAVRLSSPSLALFLIGGALIGAGAGTVYKGTTGIVLGGTPPENRVAMSSALVIAVFVGLSVPVIGAGIALNAGASVASTVRGFAIFVALGVSLSCWALLR